MGLRKNCKTLRLLFLHLTRDHRHRAVLWQRRVRALQAGGLSSASPHASGEGERPVIPWHRVKEYQLVSLKMVSSLMLAQQNPPKVASMFRRAMQARTSSPPATSPH